MRHSEASAQNTSAISIMSSSLSNISFCISARFDIWSMVITLSFYEIIKWLQVFLKKYREYYSLSRYPYTIYFYSNTLLRLPFFWYIFPSCETITPVIFGVLSRVSQASFHGITQSAVAYPSVIIPVLHST